MKKSSSKSTSRKKAASTRGSTKKSKTGRTSAKAGASSTSRRIAASGKKTKKKTQKKSASQPSKKTLGARSVAEAASSEKADSDGYVYINGRRVRMISTRTTSTPKKVRSQKPAAVEVEAEEPVKLARTPLTAKDLRYYRGLLLLKRAEIVGDLSAMESAALEAGGNLSHLPIHMADVGSDTYDQDFNLGLAEGERVRLREIDDALQRIEDKTYGICQKTGKPIPKARLNAKPWAKYTIEAARQIEEEEARR